ncbi:MAG: peptide chain release factor 2 [Candidatus Marinimicrobia bacterium]|nr:peptide chain release factor 2 [Candidatus Neomarinimicrobiota bacterium]MCF7828975.1 peptide chain release factor 2 [Candidatus Neomarinimicrobiota bacterium]MCF7879935.1 peptide chain release factor 2 [Candidatus Neomarinimicrobiota bacterium]
MYDDIRSEFTDLEERFQHLRNVFDIDSLREQKNALQQETTAPDFWDDQHNAQQTLQKISQFDEQLDQWENVRSAREELEIMLELAEETGDESLGGELASLLKKYRSALGQLELQAMLSDEDDANNAIMTIHPGAGGTESQDWASMLYRMYTRWIERKGWQYKVIDYQPGEEAGLKNVSMEILGNFAYGYAKAEAGIHRLVRISPFDSDSRRHTSFASVFVYPEVDDEIEVDIEQGDLRIDTYRASGAGGQHVNKTDSAVRITHEPTGIVVQCQNERSQHKNKANAMKMLKAKLYQKKREEAQAELDEMEANKKDISWGNQIRSYVFHPYSKVKDHRTDVETGNTQAVMDGDIDEFVRGYLLNTMAQPQ